jgi:CRISPR-associated protein Cmr1
MSRGISARQGASCPIFQIQKESLVYTVSLRFLSPVFGGGVDLDPDKNKRHQRKADPITPVRSASVRGQLRAWWRLACGRGLEAGLLRRREGLLWGLAEQKGWVSVEVDGSGLEAPREIQAFEKGASEGLAYGAFPLQPPREAKNEAAGVLRSYSGTFTVTLRGRGKLTGALEAEARKAWTGESSPEDAMWNEAKFALEVFATLGAFGGRTRRGFGAVEKAGGGVGFREILRELQLLEGRDWALSGQDFRDPQESLAFALGRLRAFRQGPNIGRNPGTKGPFPGRSRWPEPDEIRRITRRNARDHKPEHPVRGFPRAAFGLPIIFHFKDEGDPMDTTLTPEGKNRMSSPLLLRPIQEGERFRALALILPGNDLGRILPSLALTSDKGKKTTKVDGRLREPDFRNLLPLQPHVRKVRDDDPSGVLGAFLQFFPNFR